MEALTLIAALIVASGAEDGTSPARARVVDVAGGRTFVGAGRDDGLCVGTPLRVGDGRRGWLSCEVDRVSAHHASCPLRGALRGAPVRFEVSRPAAAGPGASKAPAPAGPDTGALSAALRNATFAEVEAQASPDAPYVRPPRVEAGLAAEIWHDFSDDRDPFERQRVDVRIRNVPLGFLGATAQVDATAFGWAVRPDDARFRPGGEAQLFVHEVAVESRDPTRDFTASAGRIRPWGAPGLSYVDGIQVGWRPRGRGFEIGVLGGSVPDLLTLEPTTERWTGGVYGRTQSRLGDDARLLTETRASVISAPVTDVSFEAESMAIVETGRWLRASAGARLAVDGDATRLASARASVLIAPTDRLEVDLGVRARDDRPDPLAPSFAVVGADHGHAGARYEVTRGLVLGAQAGFGHIREVGETRGWTGPTIELPRLFGATGGLSAGHREAFGWLAGRSTYVQALLFPAGSLRLLSQVSYLEDRVDFAVGRQVATYLNAGWRISRTFRLTASGYLSWVATGATASAAPFGVVGRLGVTGKF